MPQLSRTIKAHSTVLGILSLFLLLAMIYNVTTPLGEGPDEPGHLDYALFLVRAGRLPVQSSASTSDDVPGEGHQPPLAYVLMMPAVAWLPADQQQLELRANPDFLWNGGTDVAAFTRSSREYWPWQELTLAWHLARGVSMLLGAVVLLGVWGAARALFPDDEFTPLLALGLVAFNPQFLFTSALVTNDTALAALSAGLFWLVFDERRGRNAGRGLRWLLAGGLLGLALLTKQSAVLLVPLLLWASWRNSAGSWMRFGAATATWTGVALLIAGWWYARNLALYGDIFGLTTFRATFASQPFDWRDLAAWRGGLAQLYASFWARFGWMNVHPPAWIGGLYVALGGMALAGLVRLAIRPGALRNISPTQPAFALVLLPTLAFAWVVSFALTAGLVAWQGRMLFTALPAIAILLARGLLAWMPTTPEQPILAMTSMGLLAALALHLPPATIAPAYVWHTLPPATARTELGTPIYARYAESWKQGVELRGWRIDDAAPQAGRTITVTLTWHALEVIPHDWTVFVHLVDANEQIVAQDNRRPRADSFPLPNWTAGDWAIDAHPLALLADLPPGRYWLRVGLYLPQDDGRRQLAWAEDGAVIGDYVELGEIDIK